MDKTTSTGLYDPKQSPEVDKRCENCKWWDTTDCIEEYGRCRNDKSKWIMPRCTTSCELWQSKEEE